MRITFLLTKCTPDNSHGRYVIELAKCLSREHSVSVIAGAFWPPLQSLVRCRRLPVVHRPAVARLATLWMGSLIGIKSRLGEVLHVQGADAPTGNVVTAHCCNQAMKARADHGTTSYRRFNYAIGSVAEKLCMSRPSARRVIAVSHQLKEEIEREYRVDPEKVVVIHHGVDAEAFHPRHRSRVRQEARARLGLSSSMFTVLFVGADYRLKGLMPLLESARAVAGSLKILAVGVRPDRDLRRVVEREDLSHLVDFLGPRMDMASLYAAADCFALPTRYDTFSLVTLEAMASGLPVIVSRRAGVAEILTPNRDSLVLEDPNDVPVLTRHLQHLLEDNGVRNNLGVEARKTAERHSWDQVARRTLEVYHQTLGSS